MEIWDGLFVYRIFIFTSKFWKEHIYLSAYKLILLIIQNHSNTKKTAPVPELMGVLKA
jgi:hypothetical protein